MLLQNLRNGSRLTSRLYYSSFSINCLNEIIFHYKTNSDVGTTKLYEENGDALIQSRVMNHISKNNKNVKRTSFLGNPNDKNYLKEQELVNKINAGPSHDVFFNNNQNRDSILEVKILDFNNKLDNKIREVCEILNLSKNVKTEEISILENALAEANKKDLLYIESNEERGYIVEKVHNYYLDNKLFIEDEFTLLFHFKLMNNQLFDIKAIATKLRILNTDLRLDQISYIINNLTKIGRLEDVKIFLETYFNKQNIDLNGLKKNNLSKLFFYQDLNYNPDAGANENELKVEVLDNLIKIYYETEDYKYLKDLIRLRERLSPIKLVDNSTMYIRIMIRIMGNYNPYHIISISNNYIRKQNIKYEPLDKTIFYKLMESIIKVDDPFLLSDFIEVWEPVVYKGTRSYLDPMCIIMVERFKQTMLSSQYNSSLASAVYRKKINCSLVNFNNYKKRIQHFKIYEHMATLMVSLEKNLHYKPIRAVTDLIDRIASEKYSLDALAVSYFVNSILKISCNNITGVPNLVNHLFNCKVRSYNGIDLLDYSHYLIKTEYYKNRYEVFMNFFQYKPELVYQNLSTIIKMFIKNNPSLITEFELMLKCYRSTMSLDSEESIQNLFKFNKEFSKHFKNKAAYSTAPLIDISNLTIASVYKFLDINAFKRGHFNEKIRFIEYFLRYKPKILKIITTLGNDRERGDLSVNDAKFLSKIHSELAGIIDRPLLYNDESRYFHKVALKSFYNSLLRRQMPLENRMIVVDSYRTKFYSKFNIELDHVIFKYKITNLLNEKLKSIKETVELSKADQLEALTMKDKEIFLWREVEKLRRKNDCDIELNEKAISIFVDHLRDMQYGISSSGGRNSMISWSPNNKRNIQFFMEDAISFMQTSNLLMAMCESLKLYLCGFGDRKLFKNTDIKISNEKKKKMASDKYQEYTKTGDPYFRFIGQSTLKKIDLGIVRLVRRYAIKNEHLKMYSAINSNIVELFREEYGKKINLDSNLEPTIPFNCDNMEVELLNKHNLLKEIREKYSQTQIFFILKLLKELLSAREVYNKNVVKIKNIGIERLEDMLKVLNKTESLLPKTK